MDTVNQDLNENIIKPVTPEENKEEKKYVPEPGEKVFAIVLLVLGLAAFGLALELWLRMSEPRISSAAAMPLFVSGLWSIMALLIVIENIKSKSGTNETSDWRKRLLSGLCYAMPREAAVVVLAILAYCAMLLFGVSFYITTPLFLYGSMCYLTRKNYLKNILWTAIVMAFIIIVFRMLFSVVFP